MQQDRFNLPNDDYLLDGFEGFSPNEMHGLLYSTFDEARSPLILSTEIDEDLIKHEQFYNHITQYLQILQKREPLRLTQNGNLPIKFYQALGECDFFEDEFSRDWF